MSGFQPYLGISASAGSGKTFQLAHRVLRLLAMDQAPDRIGAYTFSRKAAGGIFDEIVSYLRRAATDEAGADTASSHIGIPRDADAFEADLRRLFDHMHRLRVGTLDSRIARMVSAASVELGLPAEFILLDSGSSEYLRLQTRVLDRLFQGGRLSPEDADTFLRLFEEATHGRAEKDFHRLLESFIADCRVPFLEHPRAEEWRPPRLADPPRSVDPAERERLAGGLLADLDSAVPHKTARKSLATLIRACRDYGPGSIWSRDAPSNTLWKGFLEDPSPEIRFGRSSFTLPDAFWRDLLPLLRHPLAVALDETRRRTRAVYGFLVAYQHAYQQALRTEGALAFEDAGTLMAGFHLLTPAELAFRLDGEIDHWLLDEFQDTSHLQWNALRPFVEEVLQDPERQRTFFYVGDVKQAIYGWRGGDSTLFNRVREQWPRIDVVPMDKSWRSSPAVLDLVNHLLRDLPPRDGLPAGALERWNQTFTPHEAAKSDLPGHSRVFKLPEDGPDMADTVLRLVEELPRGLETAILVRTNAEGERHARRLREAGVPVSLEGAAAVRDDTGVEALLAALKLAAHPGCRYSRRLVQLAGLHVRPRTLRDRVAQHGIAHALRDLAATLPYTDAADFSRARVRRLVDLALEFDARNPPEIDRFLAHADHARLKENEARGVVRVMTIHQSKGLGFDAVILPVGERDSMVKVSTNAPVPGGDPDPFLTLLPPKDVCLALPEFRDLYTRLEEDALYESLCTLYVALTRAKQSLQVVLPATADPGKSPRVLAHWITDRLDDADWEQGHPLTNASEAPEEASTRDDAPPAPFPIDPGTPTLARLEPSRAEEGAEPAERIFRHVSTDGRALGSRVHELLCRVEWSDALDPEAFLLEQGEDPEGDAARHVRNALATGKLRRPHPDAEVWREQKFESVLPEGWITGIFDRVVLCKRGQPAHLDILSEPPNTSSKCQDVRADPFCIIQDFKTNRATGPETVEHYRPQMALYRKVLADMLCMEPGRIHCQLLFTGTGKTVDV